MNSTLIRRCGVGLIALLMAAPAAIPSLAQTTPPTFTAPLAFINSSGNVSLESAGSSTPTPITQDANFTIPMSGQPVHNYTHLRWSPDGSKLAYQDTVTNSLFVFMPGSQPKLVASNVATEYPVAWQPDNSGIVYAVDTQQTVAGGGLQFTFNLQQVAPDGTNDHTLGTFVAQQGCGGGGLDAPGVLYGMETGLGFNPLSLTWTKSGWLISTACNGVGVQLLNASFQVQWTNTDLARVAVSPSGSLAAAVVMNKSAQPVSTVSLDLSSGRYSAYNVTTIADQLGWSADESTLFYSTVSGQQVTLWKIPAQGTQPTPLFSDHGRYIGAITSSPDSQMAVFSYIPDGGTPVIELLAVPAAGNTNGSTVTLATAAVIAQGGRPAFSGLGSTSTVTATAAACVVRTDWQYSYVVTTGDTVSSIAQRAGTTTADLAAGNCLANANTIFAGETLHVPNPTAANKRITFAPGGTSAIVQGQVGKYPALDQWVIRILAGQTLSAQLAFTSGNAKLIVYGADGTVLQSDQVGSPNFSGVVPSTQDYYLDVADVSGNGTSYTLSVAVPPLPPAPNTAKRISFGAGGTTAVVQGQVGGNGTDHWVIRILAGQTLNANLTFTSGNAILIVFGADGTVLQTDHAGSSHFSGVVPSTQDYFIDVRDITGTGSAYALTVNVPPIAVVPTQPAVARKRITFQPGATSTLAQGQAPANSADYWVLGISAGQTLNATISPTSGNAIIIIYGADGTVLQTDHVGSPSFSGVVPTTQDYYIDVRDISGSGTVYYLNITIPPR